MSIVSVPKKPYTWYPHSTHGSRGEGVPPGIDVEGRRRTMSDVSIGQPRFRQNCVRRVEGRSQGELILVPDTAAESRTAENRPGLQLNGFEIVLADGLCAAVRQVGQRAAGGVP